MILDDLTYERVTAADGRPMVRFSDGTMLPVVRGGDGPEGSGEGAGEGSGGEGESAGGEGGSGEGESSGESAPSADDIAKWKAMARKHEAASKAAQKELDKLRAASQTDSERAVTEAESKGRQAAQAEFGERLAGAEIKAALSGVVPDPAAIVEDLNLAKYVTADGEVDSEAVEALRKKYEGLAAKGGKGSGPDPLRQGQRGNAPDKGQLTLADMKSMSPEQIVKARREGRLNDVARGVGRTSDYS